MIDNVTSPVVSVIVPTYNAEKYIEKTINSVRNQSFDNWELIVIDDCSGDSTCSIVKKMMEEDSRIRLLNNETNMGVAETRNRGIKESNGKYIAFLDSDDIWYPDKLKMQIALAEKENADVVYTSYDILDADGNKVRPSYIVPESVSYEGLLKENVIGCSTVIIKKEDAGKYLFNSDYYHEDYVLWLNILEDGGKAVGCPQVLAAWRYIQNSRSFNKRSAARERWFIYRKFCKLPVTKSFALMCLYARAAIRKYK